MSELYKGASIPQNLFYKISFEIDFAKPNMEKEYYINILNKVINKYPDSGLNAESVFEHLCSSKMLFQDENDPNIFYPYSEEVRDKFLIK